MSVQQYLHNQSNLYFFVEETNQLPHFPLSQQEEHIMYALFAAREGMYKKEHIQGCEVDWTPEQLAALSRELRFIFLSLDGDRHKRFDRPEFRRHVRHLADTIATLAVPEHHNAWYLVKAAIGYAVNYADKSWDKFAADRLYAAIVWVWCHATIFAHTKDSSYWIGWEWLAESPYYDLMSKPIASVPKFDWMVFVYNEAVLP